MGNKRSYTGGRFAFSVDGKIAGFIKSVKGGTTKGEIATHNLGTDNVQKKHITTISHQPLEIQIGMGMGEDLYKWIEASFDKGFVEKNGEIIACDFDYKAMASRSYQDALITKVVFPKLDGSSKEPAYMTVTMTPRAIRYEKGDGSVVKGDIDVATKSWLSSNWRLEIGDLPCSRVATIESITWEQKITKDEVGQFREPTIHPSSLEVSNIKLGISMADYEPWYQWHQSFVIDGKCTDSDELSGALEFLTPDLQTTLGTLEFDHIGIISMEQRATTANANETQRFDVELYVETIRFKHG